MTSAVEDEWYWLREISKQLSAAGEPDGFATAQLWTSLISTLATLAIAVFAAIIAWKAHRLSIDLAARAEDRQDRDERDAFVSEFGSYVNGTGRNWLDKSDPERATLHSQQYSDLAVRALTMRGTNGIGATLLVKKVSDFTASAEAGPKTEVAKIEFGQGTAALMLSAAQWALGGLDWAERELGDRPSGAPAAASEPAGAAG